MTANDRGRERRPLVRHYAQKAHHEPGSLYALPFDKTAVPLAMPAINHDDPAVPEAVQNFHWHWR